MNHFIGSDRSYYYFKSDQKSWDAKGGDVCFARSRDTFCVLSNGTQVPETNIHVTLWFFNKSCQQNANLSNSCLITEEECRVWFDFLKMIFPFEYEFNVDAENPNRFKMEIYVTKATKVQYVWLMTAIRSVYERVNALVMMDVFNLLKYELVQTDNLMDLFKVIMSCMNFMSGQTLFYTGIIKLRSVESYREALNNKNLIHIQNIDGALSLTRNNTPQIVGFNKVFTLHSKKEDGYLEYKGINTKEAIINRYKSYYKPMIELYKNNNDLPEEFKYV